MKGISVKRVEVAEWSKAVDSGSIPKGRGFKSRLLHFFYPTYIKHQPYHFWICTPTVPLHQFSMHIICQQSESQSSAQSRPLNVLVDVLAVDGLLNHLSHTERGVSRGIEILGLVVKGTLLLSPLLHLSQLTHRGSTFAFLSCSLTLTMWPKVGMTLMLILLNRRREYPSSVMLFWKDMILSRN